MTWLGYFAIMIFLMAAGPKGNSVSMLLALGAMIAVLLVASADHRKLWK